MLVESIRVHIMSRMMTKTELVKIIRQYKHDPELLASVIIDALKREKEARETIEDYALLVLSKVQQLSPVPFGTLRREFYGAARLREAINLLKSRGLIYQPRREYYRITPGGVGLLNENTSRCDMGFATRFPTS